MTMPADSLSRTFAALADPTRRAILARLAAGEVTELAEPFEISLPAGLIERRRQAQWRPCRLEAGPLKDVADWTQQYREFWEESFDRLEEYLRELKEKEGRARRRPKV